MTMRQLEALIRLAQARAKCDMRSIVELRDAEDVIEIMEDAILNIVSDGLGNMDYTRMSGCSKSKLQKKVIGEILRESNKQETAYLHYNDIDRACKKKGFDGDIRKQFGNLEQLLQVLNEGNYLLKKPKKMWQVMQSKWNKTRRGSQNR